MEAAVVAPLGNETSEDPDIGDSLDEKPIDTPPCREEKLGLWADKEPIPPWEFRKQKK